MYVQKSSGSTITNAFILWNLRNELGLVSYISVPKEDKKDEPPPKKKKKEPQPTLLEEIEKELSKEIPREPPEVIALQLFTDRVRSTRREIIVSIYLSVNTCPGGGGCPGHVQLRGGGGGYPSQVQLGGSTPARVHLPRVPPSQVRTGGYPS